LSGAISLQIQQMMLGGHCSDNALTGEDNLPATNRSELDFLKELAIYVGTVCPRANQGRPNKATGFIFAPLRNIEDRGSTNPKGFSYIL
jgi:hypothetical protein